MASLLERVKQFSGEPNPRECKHDHQLQGSGAVFFQSVKLLRCELCGGWQSIRKPVGR